VLPAPALLGALVRPRPALADQPAAVSRADGARPRPGRAAVPRCRFAAAHRPAQPATLSAGAGRGCAAAPGEAELRLHGHELFRDGDQLVVAARTAGEAAAHRGPGAPAAGPGRRQGRDPDG